MRLASRASSPAGVACGVNDDRSPVRDAPGLQAGPGATAPILLGQGTDFARRRQLLGFDRFLARLNQVAGDTVTLKGGLVLELRLARARTTKDVDLRMMGSSQEVLERLQEAGRLDLGDQMRFEAQPDTEHPEIQNERMRYDGFRFRAECRLAGMFYGRLFGVDVAFGDHS